VTSRRADGRGHWPADRRRGVADVSPLVGALLAAGWTAARIAARVGASPRTVCRWRDGEDWALPANVARLEALVRAVERGGRRVGARG
jgi:hypothetical protein